MRLRGVRGLRLRLRQLRLRFDDWCGVCRLCGDAEWQVPKMTPLGVPQRYDVHPVRQYEGDRMRGKYHLQCAIAVIEARYTYEAIEREVERERF